jgi:hypothetical protein
LCALRLRGGVGEVPADEDVFGSDDEEEVEVDAWQPHWDESWSQTTEAALVSEAEDEDGNPIDNVSGLPWDLSCTFTQMDWFAYWAVDDPDAAAHLGGQHFHYEPGDAHYDVIIAAPGDRGEVHHYWSDPDRVVYWPT